MKRLALLFIWMGLYIPISAQNSTNPLPATYLEGYQIKDIADAGDHLWVLAGKDFIYQDLIELEKKTGKIKRFDYTDLDIALEGYDTMNFSFTDVECSKDGKPWVSSFDGAYRLANDDRWECMGNVSCGPLFMSNDGAFWLAQSHDLLRIEGDDIQVFDDKIQFNGVVSMAEDNEGDLWILQSSMGVLNSIFKFTFDGDDWTISNLFSSSLEDSICCRYDLKIDQNNTLWMRGYRKSTIVLLSYRENVWGIYHLPEPTTRIYTIALENESVWCGTDHGLLQFSNEQWTFFIPENHVYSILIEENHTKWLGTDEGLIEFNELDSKGLVGSDSKAIKDVELFPNPASDYISLKIPMDIHNPIVDILSIDGKLIWSGFLDSNQNQIDVSTLSAGVFLIRIQNLQNYIYKKFIKQ